jgi:Bacterial SH3 domain
MRGPVADTRSMTRLLAALLLIAPAGAECQAQARLRAGENFRAEPNGQLLARLEAGAPVEVLEERDNWLRVTVTGWVWTRSLQATDRGGFSLVVAPADGENLRDAPSGKILGQLGSGTLLEELSREPGWIRVRRAGWIWAASVERPETPTTDLVAAGSPEDEAAGGGAELPTGFARFGEGGVAILTAPDGDTLAKTSGDVDLEVIEREGSWVRIRLEGWSWLPPLGERVADSTEVAPLTPEDLRSDPGEHVGRVVAWTLQFISLERAEQVRTDFFEGEPFLLTRYGDEEGPFVYVAVPSDWLERVEGLVPLEPIAVTARVRTGASALTGTPIIDLLRMERLRARR